MLNHCRIRLLAAVGTPLGKVIASSAFPPTTSTEPLFDACFVINLDQRTDKWEHIQTQIKRAGLVELIEDKTVTRVPGVDGSQLDIDQLKAQGVVTELGVRRFALPKEEKLFGMDLTSGALGCALAHRKVWSMVSERQLKRALVLEDDAEFAPSLKKVLRSRLAVVPGDYEILYFGGLDLLRSGKPSRPFIAEGVRYAYEGHRELTAYVTHAKAAQKCLDMSSPLTWQIDTHITNGLEKDFRASLGEKSEKGGSKEFDRHIARPLSYVLQPSLAIQLTVFGTDVQKKEADNPHLEDASRRMREFVSGGTSLR